MSKQEKIILVLLASINFTHILDFMIMMPLGNYLMPALNISARKFSDLISSYTYAAFLAGFTAAFFVDKFDRKKVLLFGYTGFLIGTIACGFAPDFTLLVAARIVAGLFGGLIGAQVMSIIADLFGYERRGIATGAVMSSFAVASILGVPFALSLSNHYGWHAPFLFIGILGIAVIPLVMKFIPDMSDHLHHRSDDDHPLEMLHNVLRNKKQMLALLFSVLVMTGHFLIIPFVNPYLEFNLGFSKKQTPMVFLVGGVAALLAAIVLGKLADKIGKLKVFTITVFFSFGAVWAITNLPPVHFSLVLLLMSVWFIFGTGRAVTGQAMISNVVDPKFRGSFMSFNSSMQQLGTGFAATAAGYIVIKDKAGRIDHFEWVGYLSIAVLLLALLLARYLFGSMDREDAVSAPAGTPDNADSPVQNTGSSGTRN